MARCKVCFSCSHEDSYEVGLFNLYLLLLHSHTTAHVPYPVWVCLAPGAHHEEVLDHGCGPLVVPLSHELPHEAYGVSVPRHHLSLQGRVLSGPKPQQGVEEAPGGVSASPQLLLGRYTAHQAIYHMALHTHYLHHLAPEPSRLLLLPRLDVCCLPAQRAPHGLGALQERQLGGAGGGDAPLGGGPR